MTQIRLCVGNQLLEVQKGNRDGRFWTFEGLLILVPCNIIKALCLGAKTEHSVAAAGRMESHSNNKIVLSPPPPRYPSCYAINGKNIDLIPLLLKPLLSAGSLALFFLSYSEKKIPSRRVFTSERH